LLISPFAPKRSGGSPAQEGQRPATALHLLSKPDRLLGTILVANNMLNIAIIILAAFISSRLFDLSNNPVLSFIMEVVVITFILLLFCEVMPKVYASKNQLRFALTMAPSLALATRVFKPLASLLSVSRPGQHGPCRETATSA
jgi:Mg2+/Co2+ transporter CorB